MDPKCTVAIPVYNRRDLVRPTLESALAQEIAGLEILVVDNCSTDGTWEILQTYRVPRLRLIRNESNVGLFGNFNRCLELARGVYLRFLCSDDKLVLGCLEEEIGIMDAHPNVVLLSAAGRFVDKSGKPGGKLANQFDPGIYPGQRAIYSWFWFFSHYGYNPLNYPSGVLFRREAASRAGHFDEAMRSVGDIDFYMRVLDQGDLAISGAISCEIMLHKDQESTDADMDGSAMREHFAGVEHHRELLLRQGGYLRICRQLAAIALYKAFKYRAFGAAAAGRKHVELVRAAGVGWIAVGIALSRMLALRLLLKTTGLKIARLPSPQPLRK